MAAALTCASVGALFASPAASAGGSETKERAARYTRNVAIVLYPGVEILDFAGPSEVFAAASGYGARRGEDAFHLYTVAKTAGPLKSQGFLTITPEYTLENAPKPDLIVIPGGSTQVLVDDPAFVAWASKAVADAEITLTVCTGAFVPAKLGALDGRVATTWYGAIPSLREAAPKATVQDGRRFVDNGPIITTAGVSAGIDGALHTVARLLGRQVADRTARYMEYHWTPEPYLAQSYSYLNPTFSALDRELQAASVLEDERRPEDAAAAYRAIVARVPNDGWTWSRLGRLALMNGNLDEAIDALGKATSTSAVLADSARANALYNLGCAYARKGRKDDAIEALTRSVGAGSSYARLMRSDPDLESLRADARFQKLTAEPDR